jgi:DNA-binding MarR family transcriptional regulator
MRKPQPAKRPRRRASSSGTKSGKARTSPAHQSFIYKIGILRRVIDRYSGPALVKQSGLTVAEWRVLTPLYEAPATALQLRLKSHADKAEISRACAGLIAKGFARSEIDPNDRRSSVLAITPRGIKLHNAIIPLRQALQDELEAALSKREVAELRRILDKLTQHLLGSMKRASG